MCYRISMRKSLPPLRSREFTTSESCLSLCWMPRMLSLSVFSYSTLIDDAIENVLRMRNESAIGNLTSQDLFYVKVTRVQELIKVFSNLGDEQIQNKQGNSGLSSSLLDIGTIILVDIMFIFNR